MLPKLTLTVATLAISAGLAGQADAATSVVKLHTEADTSKFLADTTGTGSSALASMLKSSSSDLQRWIRTDTDSGHATYRNKATGRCLTGRPPVGFPVVTAEPCVAGATRQQWRLGVAKDFRLRLNGAAMRHNTAGNGTGVVVANFTAPIVSGPRDMKWHTHLSS